MMALLDRVIGGLRALVQRNRVERELDEELRAYVESAVTARMAAGLSREAAERAALVEIGSLAAVKDHTHDAGWESFIDNCIRDVRYAARSFRRSPAFTAVAIATLALGIGSSTAIFSVVDAVVLRALPFDEHDRLVAVGTSAPSPFAVPLVTRPQQPPSDISVIAPQDFFDWRERQKVFTQLAAYSISNVTLRADGQTPEELSALRVTGDLFDVLRVPPFLGRALLREDETAGRRVAVIGYGLWQRRFGGVPDIVGRSIRLDYTSSYEVIGVAPPEFTFPIGAERPTEIWLPLVASDQDRVRVPGRYSASLRAVGRLAPGVPPDAALAQMNDIARALEAEHPEWNRDRRVGLLPLDETVVGERTRSWMWLLLGSVAMVLLIVCANVAGLLLARASAREREMAIRAAIGAGRRRLIRQMLIEAAMLWTAAALAGLLAARWGVDVLRAAMPEGIPRVASITLDLRVLTVAIAAAVATSLIFGLVPALHAARPVLTTVLTDGSRGSAGRRMLRLRSLLVVGQIGLAMVLLVGAGLFIRSFARVMTVDLGFDPRNVLTAGVILFRSPPGLEPRGWAPLEELAARIRTIPGVVDAAGISGTIPLANSTSMTRLNIPGRPFSHEDTTNRMFVSSVTPAYHRVMRIALRAGRYLEDTDRETAAPVMVINEAAAKQFFGDDSPIGRTLPVGETREIVGVVADVRQGGFETGVAPTAYVPLGQSSRPGAPRSAQLLVRTTGDPLAVLPQVRAAVAEILPGEPVRDAGTLEAALARLLAQRRVSMLLLGLFGVLGLVIAAVGVYGVMALTVWERMHELGVRMALGATRSEVVAVLLRKALTLTALGLAVGLTGAWFLRSAVRAFLFEVEPTDPRVIAAALLVLVSSALAASALPARRAAAVDPLVALRNA